MAAKRALVLSGGSIKGAFQAGAVSRILERFEPDLVIGTSVGSLNGGFVTARNGAGSSWTDAGAELVDFWIQRIRRFDDIGKRRNPVSILFSLRRRFDGVLNMDRLYRIIEENIRVDDINRSDAHFLACAVNLATGQAEYGESASPNLVDYIVASTAIPLLMPIRMIGSAPYWDGGVREVAPLKKAIELGATEIVCVACDPEHTPVVTIPGSRAPFAMLTDRLMSMVVNETLNNDIHTVQDVNEYLEHCGAPSGLLAERSRIDLHVIRPPGELVIELESFRSADIRRLIDAGRNTADQEYPRG